jgi:hypothetical protein
MKKCHFLIKKIVIYYLYRPFYSFDKYNFNLIYAETLEEVFKYRHQNFKCDYFLCKSNYA